MVNIEAQKLLIKKTKMEISLFRLEQCAKQAKLGVTFKPNTPSAVTCEDIIVNIPLGKSPTLCHEATQVNIEAQRLLIKKTKMEISLYRLEMCAKQAKLGATYKPGTPEAATCQNIEVNIPPNQVIPHTHKLQ